MPESPRTRADQVKDRAAELGFDAYGIARAEPPDPENRLGQWLDAGYHADMEWMRRSQDIRQDVTQKLPGTQSVIVVARNYYAERPDASPGSGVVSRYAWGRDYHKTMLRPLRALAAYVDEIEEDAKHYCSIDSGPVLERAWAARAGIGWIGKNSLVLRQDLGSWFFLATIITTVELAPDTPLSDHCGSCRACIDACPTQAIVEPKALDSRRCLSYQTVENRGDIPGELHESMGTLVFGCDICQEVCPWNRSVPAATEADFLPRPGVANPALSELLAMSPEDFLDRFAGTPIMRAKHAGMQRNARIAHQNIDR